MRACGGRLPTPRGQRPAPRSPERDLDPGDRPGPRTRRVAAPYQLGTDVPLLELDHLRPGFRAIDEYHMFGAAYCVLGEADLGLGDTYWLRIFPSVRR